MNISAKPITDLKSECDYETDILSFDYRSDTLSIIVDTGLNTNVHIDFDQQIWAFRQLEEGDLSYYWESNQFREGYLGYEITSGGWLSKEGSNLDILGIASSESRLKEWFIPTKNMSLFVLSNSEPNFHRIKNA